MRPELLNPLFAEVSTVKGIGDKTAALFARLLRGEGQGPARLADVLLHLPASIIDRRFKCTVAQLPVQGIATLEVTIGKHRPPPRGSRLPYRVEAFDDTGKLTIVHFAAFPDQMARQYPVGEKRLISGAISWFSAEAQMTHPDYVLPLDQAGKMPALEPVYPLTEGLNNRLMQRAAAAALDRMPVLDEWQDRAWRERQAWPSFNEALRQEHRPQAASAAPDSPARRRLAYDELLANQVALSLVRARMKRAKGRVLQGDGKLRHGLEAALPYTLTAGQHQAIADIVSDMAMDTRMMRLLQGDVGAGKTVVALMALANAVEAGAQGAFMAPTEILARQHFASLSKVADKTKLRLEILTGREKGRARDDTLARLKKGEIDVLIGTHAVFQDGVEFHDLGLVVIDEQHRFGVHQRLALQDKGDNVDLLVMTATPIPRTLALTVYGDMDVSRLTEKPAGRKPIATRVMPMNRIEELIDGLRRSLAAGIRAYWVCPLVAESEVVDLAAAEDRFAILQDLFPGQVGLVHGRLKGPQKDAVMADFKAGKTSILVATTVIEVGVDVPEAAIMVIENAERFGLSQLHQLRGRVGRGAAQSSCILLYDEPLGETARKRLSIMRDTDDGFVIAEEDLKLRGAGEMLGTAQSGLPLFKIADLARDAELLAVARDDAQLVLAQDPALQSQRGVALRYLLYIFERDSAVRLLSSG